MSVLTDIIRFITISHLLVLLFLLWKAPVRKHQFWAMVYMAASTVGFLLADWDPLQQYPVVFFSLLWLPMTLPLAFWLFSKALFDDNFRWKRWFFWVALGMLTVHYIGLLSRVSEWVVPGSTGWTLSTLSPQLVSLFFVFLAIIEAVRNRSSDLILSRLRFRTIFVFIAALAIVFTILFEIGLTNLPVAPALDLFQKMSIAGLIFYFSLQRLAFKPGFFKEQEASLNPPAVPEVDEMLVKQLLEAVEIQQVYRQGGLTIRQFAQQLEVKEYKLRQVINQHLGFKNFNEFLNSYRIREARQILGDPVNKELTILEIAYDLGYQSLAPFNKAFKEMTGSTPTSYRKEQLRSLTG